MQDRRLTKQGRWPLLLLIAALALSAVACDLGLSSAPDGFALPASHEVGAEHAGEVVKVIVEDALGAQIGVIEMSSHRILK